MWGNYLIVIISIYPNISLQSEKHPFLQVASYNLYILKATMSEGTPIKEKKEKKEKKDKKRKSEAADVTMDTETPIKPEVVPPAEGTASAEAVAMEVDGEKAAKKAKKEKRKSVGGDVAAEEQDAKVSSWFLVCDVGSGWGTST
jgi:hypothetical protein